MELSKQVSALLNQEANLARLIKESDKEELREKARKELRRVRVHRAKLIRKLWN
jgi:S-adenosylmethionine:diacylglycerol 3-amino-3-carboxypropyl transferase